MRKPSNTPLQVLCENKTKIITLTPILIDEVSTIAGGRCEGFTDGKGIQATFYKPPGGICWNPHNTSVLICDKYNNAVRKLDTTGSFSSLLPFPFPFPFPFPYKFIGSRE